MLSDYGIQDSCQTTWPTWHPMQLRMGDPYTSSPCKFGHCASNYYWLIVNVEFGDDPCWVWEGGGVTQHTKKPKLLKMAWKWPWLIFTMLSYPPPKKNSTCLHTDMHIQTDGDYTKHVVTPFKTTHLKNGKVTIYFWIFTYFGKALFQNYTEQNFDLSHFCWLWIGK